MSRIGLGRHGSLEENAGDPLDGLVNLFDIGIVLAVAFLIAGLALTVDAESGRIEPRAAATAAATAGAPGDRVRVVPEPSAERRARGPGRPVGTVYRLADGRLVIVEPR